MGEEQVLNTIDALLDSAKLDEMSSHLAASAVELFEPYPHDVWAAGRLGSARAWVRWDDKAGSPAGPAVVAAGAGRWQVVAAQSVDLQDAVVRLGRELLRTELARRGGYTLHASCATIDGAGYLLCGGSGAGKTTLALALGVARSGALVSGDQTELVRDGAGRLVAAGFPWSLRIGYGTLRAMGFEPASGSKLTRLAREGALVTSKPAPTDKLELTFAEAQSLLGCPVVSAAHVACIVVVRAEEGIAEPTATLVPSGSRLELLEPHSREPDPSFGSFWLTAGEPHPSDSQSAKVLRDLTRDVPVVDLRWSPGSHPVNDAIQALWAAFQAHEGSR